MGIDIIIYYILLKKKLKINKTSTHFFLDLNAKTFATFNAIPYINDKPQQNFLETSCFIDPEPIFTKNLYQQQKRNEKERKTHYTGITN